MRGRDAIDLERPFNLKTGKDTARKISLSSSTHVVVSIPPFLELSQWLHLIHVLETSTCFRQSKFNPWASPPFGCSSSSSSLF